MRRFLFGLILAVAAAWAIVPSAQASYTVTIKIETYELRNRECLHRAGPFCIKSRLQAIATVIDSSGKVVLVCRGPEHDQFDVIIATESLVCRDAERFLPSTRVTGDFTVRMTLIDRITGNSATLGNSPASAYETGLFPGGKPVSVPYQNSDGTTSDGKSVVKFRVIADAVPSVISIDRPKADPIETFNPDLGQVPRFHATLTEPTRVEYTVTSRATGQSSVLFTGPAWNREVNLDWDTSRAFADGVYDLRIRDVNHFGAYTPFNESRPVKLSRVTPPLPEVRINAISPATNWDFRNGPLTVNGSATAAGALSLEITNPGLSGCDTLGQLVWTGGGRHTSATIFDFDWDGQVWNGQTLAGDYCLRAKLEVDGMPAVYSNAVALSVYTQAGGLEAWVLPDPIIPIDASKNGFLTLHATVTDRQHARRYASTVTIELAAAGAVGTPVPFMPRTVATCTRAATCTAKLPADLVGAPAIAYRATASERPGTWNRQTWAGPWRITDLNPVPGQAWRASVPALVDAAGMLNTPAVNFTLDVAFYPGSGNDLARPEQAQNLATMLQTTITHLFGLSSVEHGPTSFASHSSAVAFYLWPQRVVDVHNAGCNWSGVQRVPYAEVHGVLHQANCRDAADSWTREFTADNPRTAWHELHHALYGEDDEYCCDSAYGISSATPNIFTSQADCIARTASPPSGCTRLIDRMTDAPALPSRPNSQWWRGDPLPDVMVFNDLIENPDDRRAADAVYAKCAVGRC